jgi:hypothetical protein
MIHFISRYFYHVHRNKVQMLSRDERKAMLLTCGIILCIAVIALLWMLS